MKAETRKMLQWVIVVGMIAAAIRLGIIFYNRVQARRPPRTQQETLMNPDYYVTPKKLHAYDVASARELTRQPVWVREGYRYSYFPYNAARHQADLHHVAGLLGPIEKLDITDVVTQPTAARTAEKQLLALFDKHGSSYAVPIGTVEGGNFNIYADEIFYIQDPHDLYKHWPAEVWQTIEQHQVKPGMNEIQTAFALGMGVPHPMNANEKTVDYPNGGNPNTVTFRNGKAVDVQPGTGHGNEKSESQTASPATPTR